MKDTKKKLCVGCRIIKIFDCTIKSWPIDKVISELKRFQLAGERKVTFVIQWPSKDQTRSFSDSTGSSRSWASTASLEMPFRKRVDDDDYLALAAAAVACPGSIRWATAVEKIEIKKRSKSDTKIGVTYQHRKGVSTVNNGYFKLLL